MRISTVTSCYRGEAYLPAFFESVASQSWANRIEVVLDHSCPSDYELACVEQFRQKFAGSLIHQVHQERVPLGVAWNKCLELATGDFLTIWNVDDMRTPDSVEVLTTGLLKNARSDLSFGDFEVVRKLGARSGELLATNAVDPAEFTRSMMLGPFFMFRRRLAERVGPFDEQLHSALDFDFAVRAALHKANPLHVNGLLGFFLNEGKGASTYPNSSQAVERTVVELRYGIFDKVDFRLVPKAMTYDVHSIHHGSSRLHVPSLVPDYFDLIEERVRNWEISCAGGLGRGLARIRRRIRRRIGSVSLRRGG